MKKPLPTSSDDFEHVISSNSYYVDKTYFVEELLQAGTQVTLITRPRRFGKTLNMSMLEHFFSLQNAEQNRLLFKDLYISKTSYFETHQGKFPVIFMSLKALEGANIEQFTHKTKALIARIFRKHEEILPSLNQAETKQFNFYLNPENNADLGKYAESISFLCEMLFKAYNPKAVVLIDEYDSPMLNAWAEEQESGATEFFKDCMMFMRGMLSNALKTNPYLERAVLTGIMRVSKENIFSGLNNVEVFSITKKTFSNCLGFTKG